jgi:hypothetical protein
MRKFFKKIGKKIKKIGKEIGKPFKKLMKTKIGKIIGTIGMMMIGGWMMAGAKSFVGTMWAGEGMAAAFTEGIGAMGNAAKASYTTITEGVKGMFTKNGATTVKDGATDLATSVSESGETIDVTKQAINTTKTKILEEGTIKASGKVVGDDALAGSLKSSIANLPEAGSAGSSLKWDAATNKFIPKTQKELMAGKLDLAMQAEPSQYIAQKKGMFGLRTDDISMKALKDPITGEAIIPKGFTEVDSLTKPSLLDKVYDMPFEEIKDKTYSYKPFKSFESLPGVIREGTVGEGMVLRTALQTPEEPYFGSSDMTGAYAALDVNSQRLYTGNTPSMAELGDGRTSMPSPSVIGTEDYFNNTRKAGFIYDTSLLAIKPSEIAA